MAAGRASRSASCRRSRAPSAARAAGASRAASSTPRRSPRARRAGPCSTPTGRLVGINTNRIGEGFYLALPADAALRDRIDALGRGESPKRPRLGVAVAPSHVAQRMRRSVGLPERDGVLVRGVEDGSPAAAAGIEAGDLIVEAGGRPVTDADELFAALGDGRVPVRGQARPRDRRADRPGRRRHDGVRRGLTPCSRRCRDPTAEPDDRSGRRGPRRLLGRRVDGGRAADPVGRQPARDAPGRRLVAAVAPDRRWPSTRSATS